MTPRTSSVPDSDETARDALVSALRRRGLAPRNDSSDGSVTVEFGYRVVSVRLGDEGWTRPVPGEPGSTVVLARQGNEEALARQLARELLDRLP